MTDNGVPVPHLLAWRGGFGDMTVPSPSAAQHSIHYDAAAGKLVTNSAKDAKNGPLPAVGQLSFAGMEDAYFAAVFLPGNGTTEIDTFDDKAPTPYSSTEEQLAGAAVGGDGVNRFALFVGPKDLDILKKVNPKLEQVVDFGWFSFIAKPLFLVMHWLNRQLRPQLRLVHYPDDGVHQLRAVPAEDHQHEVDEEDAGAAAADRRHQR